MPAGPVYTEKGAGAAVRGHGAHKRRGGARTGRARAVSTGGGGRGRSITDLTFEGERAHELCCEAHIGKGKPGRECVGARRARTFENV